MKLRKTWVAGMEWLQGKGWTANPNAEHPVAYRNSGFRTLEIVPSGRFWDLRIVNGHGVEYCTSARQAHETAERWVERQGEAALRRLQDAAMRREVAHQLG